jgi:hypothetical protein
MDIIEWVKELSNDSEIKILNEHIIQELIDENKITEQSIVRNSKGKIVTIRGIIIVDSGQITLRTKKRSNQRLDPTLLNDFFVSQKIGLN